MLAILVDRYGNRVRVNNLGNPIDEQNRIIDVFDARHVFNEDFVSTRFWSIFS
jgi:hypothetical protein